MKIDLDKYYTESDLARHCVEKTFEILGSNWDRVIEPSAGAGSFLEFLPRETLAYDIMPEDSRVIEQDYLSVDLPFIERSLVIGNPPFGRANKLSVKFIKKSINHSGYVSFIQPISQLNNDRTSSVDLIYSEDLGTVNYSGKPVHCCLNIYKKNLEHRREKITTPGIIECRHIFRTGKAKHKDEIISSNWTFRVAAWGRVRLLKDGEICTNEVVILCEESAKQWVEQALNECSYSDLISCVSSPNLTSWRLKKYLHSYYLQNIENVL